LNVTEEEIKEAIKKSDVLEIDSLGLRFRRSRNSPIPSLKLLNRKRKGDDGKDREDENPEGVDP
jgi:hypothetical protein